MKLKRMNKNVLMVDVAGYTLELVSLRGDDLLGHEEQVPFAIGKTLVTNALWKRVMGSLPSADALLSDPVTYVSWDDCQLFLQKINQLTGFSFDLPSEAQWLIATEGIPLSGDADNVSTPLIIEATGTLWEWCRDRYTGDPFAYTITPDIELEVMPPFYVLRGSTCYVFGFQDEPCERGFSVPTQRSADTGFRLVMELLEVNK